MYSALFPTVLPEAARTYRRYAQVQGIFITSESPENFLSPATAVLNKAQCEYGVNYVLN